MPSAICTAVLVTVLSANTTGGDIKFRVSTPSCEDSDGSFEYSYVAETNNGKVRKSSRNVTWVRTHDSSKSEVTDKAPLTRGERLKSYSIAGKRCTCYTSK
jgi:hypothetical protein